MKPPAFEAQRIWVLAHGDWMSGRCFASCREALDFLEGDVGEDEMSEWTAVEYVLAHPKPKPRRSMRVKHGKRGPGDGPARAGRGE